MDADTLMSEVRRRRAAGASPKEIARALGVRPSVVAPLVRQVAKERCVDPSEQPELAGCWVSPGWSRELLVNRRDGWQDVDLGPRGPAGVALAVVARTGRHDRMSVCGYLVDTFCLGVKNAIGPSEMRRRDLPGFRRRYFSVFGHEGLPVPLELAQHLVLAGVAFAAGLGFTPHVDFEPARGHLGELDEPCAITFGRDGQPFYVAGPYDDATAILRTLHGAAAMPASSLRRDAGRQSSSAFSASRSSRSFGRPAARFMVRRAGSEQIMTGIPNTSA